MYDVVIVGAGPAGLFSAYELIENNPKLKVLLLDKGKFASNRICPMKKTGKCVNCNPCNITTGFSGAGMQGNRFVLSGSIKQNKS